MFASAHMHCFMGPLGYMPALLAETTRHYRMLRAMAICLFYKLSESHDHRRDTNLTMDDVSAVCEMKWLHREE